ncbi:hypothetical protein [Roseivirga sp. E12]|uniref:hypothetical protein n=1 Tax=Roseivirga sp. E12 TaxID=2819237 RepID=UPI001ABCDFEB|nr:hypothetical protein [Roseivirga sp. E12]MBO3697815.1 hypothetical protein [Roseivirga sp. E12]
MSNKSRDHNKKWLISRLKTSGSKRKYVESGDYADTRNSKKQHSSEDLPKYEGMGRRRHFFNNKVNYGLLIRFLRGRIGDDWDGVYEEIMDRIPTNLAEYKDCVQWFVADLVEEEEDGLWDKREQKYLKLDPEEVADFNYYTFKEFYVHPSTNKLSKIADSPACKRIKGMSKDELRTFRELQQKQRLAKRQSKKATDITVQGAMKQKREP